MKVNMERYSNNTDGRKPKNGENNLSQYYFTHHKSHNFQPGIKSEPPRGEAGD
jgi:hypothetical protein